jgi:hypothetical protein
MWLLSWINNASARSASLMGIVRLPPSERAADRSDGVRVRGEIRRAIRALAPARRPARFTMQTLEIFGLLIAPPKVSPGQGPDRPVSAKRSRSLCTARTISGCNSNHYRLAEAVLAWVNDDHTKFDLKGKPQRISRRWPSPIERPAGSPAGARRNVRSPLSVLPIDVVNAVDG